jgi:hypothetical protein
VVLVLQPLENDGCVQAARVGENNALRGLSFARGWLCLILLCFYA